MANQFSSPPRFLRHAASCQFWTISVQQHRVKLSATQRYSQAAPHFLGLGPQQAQRVQHLMAIRQLPDQYYGGGGGQYHAAELSHGREGEHGVQQMQGAAFLSRWAMGLYISRHERRDIIWRNLTATLVKYAPAAIKIGNYSDRYQIVSDNPQQCKPHQV